MLQLFRRLLLVCLVKPIAKLIIGMDVRGKRYLPTKGPAIIAANHNSHIDTLLLICLFPSGSLRHVRPVAAADHFLRSPLSSWFSQKIVGILPIDRKGGARRDVLAGCREALEQNEILLLFPVGTRGEAEEMGDFKSGVARLAEKFPETPIVPVYLQGAGRVLPRGARILVPFTCSAIIGTPFHWDGDRVTFMKTLKSTIEALSAAAPPLRWI